MRPCEKHLKDNKHNSIHLASKICTNAGHLAAPPTNSPPSKVTSAHGLKNEEYTSFGGKLVGGEIPWWRGDRIPYAQIFVLGHYLFLEAHSFVRHSELMMSADKYSFIFSRQKEAIVYISDNIKYR